MPKKKTTMTVGAFLFDYLHKQGVRHAFGIPGDFFLPTVRWLHESEIDFITMTHEPSIAFAADAYARVNGLGIACATYCVGGLNMLNGIACAYAEKSPVVVITGGPSTQDKHGDQLIHHKVKTFETQHNIYKEVTCASTVLDDPETAAEEIIRVVEAIRYYSRPGYIEVPYDVVNMPITLPKKRKPTIHKSDKEMLEAAIEETAGRLNKAKRPVIIADIELHRHGLTDWAVDFAKAFNIPIAATLLSKSLIRETNPLYIGVYSGGFSEPECREYVESSDCVLMLGAFISDVFLGQYTASLDRKNSILVTTEKVSVGLHRYDGVLFKDFLKALLDAPITAKKPFKNPNPFKAIEPLGKNEESEPLTAENIFRLLSLNLSEGDTMVCDTGDALFGAIGIRTKQRKHFLSDAYYLSMGFAVPASIGVLAKHKGEGRVFTIVGDGAFQMTGTELSTAAKYGLNPIVIVINNDGYGTQRHIIDGPFNDINPWDYAGVCTMIGYGKGVRVKTNIAFETALKNAIKYKGMTVIEAVIPRDDCSRPLRMLGEMLGKARTGKKRGK